MLEHKAVCTVVDGHHEAAEDKAPALTQKAAPLGRRDMQRGTAAPLVQPQQYNRRYGIVNGVGYGKPAHILAQNQKQHLVGGDDYIAHRCGDGCIFRFQAALKPVLDGVKRLKEQRHAVKRHHRHGQALSTIHDGHNGNNGHRGQRAGQQPHGNGGSHGRSGILRVFHKVLQKKRTQSQGCKGCKKSGIQCGIVDKSIVARPKIARREQIDQKGQRHMQNSSCNQPPCVFSGAPAEKRNVHICDICRQWLSAAARPFRIKFRGRIPG